MNLRYNRYIRWCLVRVHDYLPFSWQVKVGDYLYPDDAVIAFRPPE